MKIGRKTKLILLWGISTLWGIIAGRAAPQWQEMQIAPSWYGVGVYIAMILTSGFVVWRLAKIGYGIEKEGAL